MGVVVGVAEAYGKEGEVLVGSPVIPVKQYMKAYAKKSYAKKGDDDVVDADFTMK